MPGVLVVDDEVDMRLLVEAVIERANEGLKVVGLATTGAEAIARFREINPDVILLDHVMPGMDGPATARALRNAGVEARLVGLTGTTLPEDLAACKDAGMDLVLAKPLRPEDLLESLL